MYGSNDQAIPFTSQESGGQGKILKRPFEGIIPQLQRQYADASSTADKNDR